VVGSSFLPQLAQSFADAAQRATDFISHARETGQLHTFIQTGIDAFRELFAITKDVVAIFVALAANPPFGPSLLDLLLGLTAGIRWFVDHVPFATTIIEAFIIAWRLAPIIGVLSTLITAMGGVTLAGIGMTLATGGIILVIAALGFAIFELVTHWNAVTAAFNAFLGYLTSTFMTGLGQIGTGIAGFATSIGSMFVAGLNQMTAGTASFFGSIGQQFVTGLQQIGSGVASFATSIGSTFVTGLNQIGSGIGSFFSSAGQQFVTGLNQMISAVGSFFGNLGSMFVTGLQQMGTTVVNGVNYVVSIMGGLGSRVLSVLGNIGNLLYGVGSDIINGIGRGIQAGWNYLTSLVANLATSLYNAAKSALGISSPSRKFAEIGRNAGIGLIDGITGITPAAVNAAKQMALAIADAGTVDLTAALPTGSIGLPASIQALMASVQQTDGTPDLPSRQAAPLSVVQNIYNPSMTDATDSSNRELRRFAALGGFTR
jgi:hypothetical protein